MAEIDYKFISELPPAGQLSKDDLFIVSQVSGDYDYLSKRITYQQLSADFAKDLSGNVYMALNAELSGLSVQVYINKNDISALSGQMSSVITAIIKMANCIQYNKIRISALYELYSQLSDASTISNYILNDPVSSHQDISGKAPSFSAVYVYGQSLLCAANTYTNEICGDIITNINSTVNTTINNRIKNDPVSSNSSQTDIAPSYNAVYNFGKQISDYVDGRITNITNIANGVISNDAVSVHTDVTSIAPSYQAVYEFGKQISTACTYTLSAATSSDLGGVKVWYGTSADYANLSERKNDTLYFIHD